MKIRIAISAILTLILALSLAYMFYLLVALFKNPTIAYFCMLVAFVLLILIFGESSGERLVFVTAISLVPFLGFAIVSLIYLEKFLNKKNKNIKGLKNYKNALKALKQEHPQMAKVAEYVDYQTNFPVLFSNDIVYFSSTKAYIDSIISDVRRAEKYVYMEFYILKHGVFFSKLFIELCKALNRGVKVSITVDFIGSGNFESSYLAKELKSRGAKISTYKEPRVFIGLKFNTRTHRKITVIDGEIGYLGGINFSDDELKAKDSGLRLVGDAVKSIESMFFRLNKKTYSPKYQGENLSKGFVQPFSVAGTKTLERIYIGLLAQAKNEVVISTPYLSFGEEVFSQLSYLVKAGIKIKFLLSKNQSKLVIMVNEYYAEKLFKLGCEIYHYEPQFLHEKLIIIDDNIALAGSPNFDLRSASYQIESGIIIYDNRVIDSLLFDFNLALKRSMQDTKFSYKKGLMSKVKQRLSVLMAYFV